VHTEHLNNVRVGWVVTGWVVAVAVASLTALVLVALGVLAEPAPEEVGGAGGEGAWVLLAVVAGFLAGGLFLGFRSIDAPILHGLGMGVVSLVAWLVLNLAAALLFGGAGWPALTPTWSAAVLLLQLAAAVAGAWIGHRLALRGTVPEGVVGGG
jgi:hypothetical protein